MNIGCMGLFNGEIGAIGAVLAGISFISGPTVQSIRGSTAEIQAVVG